MRRGRAPRGERGILTVPVLPGSTWEPPVPVATSHARRVALAAGAAVVIGGIALATALLAHGPSHTKTQAVTSAVTSTAPPVSRPATTHRVTAAQQAAALAGRVASRLPVALASTALVRSAGAVYAVGGVGRDGRPSDGIWKIDLATGTVVRDGSFVEPLTDAAIARRGGVLYLAGGWTGTKLASAVLRWVPGQSSTLVARLPVAVRGASAGFSGDLLYVSKGSTRYAVDVTSGTVTTAAHVPSKLAAAGSNLAYLGQSLLATRG